MRHYILTAWFILISSSVMAQDFNVPDSLFADSIDIDTTNYEVPVQRNFNALQYSLDNHHSYIGDLFTQPINYIEIGGGRMSINDTHKHDPDPLFLFHMRFGRQYNAVSSLRLGISGGVGFIPQKEENTFYNSINGRVALEADYLYSITTHLLGYRPDRLLDVSGFVGIGAGFSRLFKSNIDDWNTEFNTRRATAFARTGFQLKFFAGPQAALAVEPYVYASTRGIDLVRSEHEFYDYRMGMGFDISFIQYLGNRLSDEQNAGTFKKNYSRQQRYFTNDVADILYHHPMIVGVQTGVGGVSGDGRTFNRSAGLMQSAYIGWWLSPSIGVRGQIGAINMKWQDWSDTSLKNFVAYRTGAFDLMLNPFGFSRRAGWQSPAGITLLLGYEGGYAFREKGIKGFPVFGYRGGVNLWARLANGLRVTVEPQYAVLTHKNDNLRASIDYLTRLSIGVEMMVGGDREPAEADDGTKPFPTGYYIGGGIGRNFTPRYYQETSRERDWIKSGLLFAGYEYNDLHSLRLSGEYMTDVFYHQQHKDRQERWVLTAGYKLAVSNLLRGINPHRRWNVSANIGPAIAFGNDTPLIGANTGLQLDYRLGKHFSLFLAQNLYWIPGGLYDSDQTTELNITNSYNLGVMYHFENLVQPTIHVAKTVAHATGNAAKAVGTAGVAVGNAIGAAGAAVGTVIGDAGAAIGTAMKNVSSAIVDQQPTHPFFIEYALGYQHIMHMPTKGIDTWEPQMQLGIGWWALPAIGLRAGADLIRGSSKESRVIAENGTFTRYDKLRLSFIYADLVINPLGFARQYNWQQPAGINLLVGRTLFNLSHHNIEERYWKNGWRLGTQLWAKLAQGFRLNIEPMFSLTECEPQSSDPTDYTSKDHRDIFSLKVGVTMMMQQKKDHDNHTIVSNVIRPRWFIGLGGGLHFNKDDYRLDGGGTNCNIQAIAGYRIWKNTTIRLSEELTFDHFIDNCRYQLTSSSNAGKWKNGRGITTYRFLFSSLAYQYDLMGLFNDNPARRWEFNILGGFALSYYLNESTTVPGETASYEVSHANRISPLNFNTLIGMMLNYRISDRLSAYFNHHLYIYSYGQPQWVHYTPQIWSISGHINTFNAGLMIHF